MKRYKTLISEIADVIQFPGNKRPSVPQNGKVVQGKFPQKELEIPQPRAGIPERTKVNDAAKQLQKRLSMKATILRNRFIVFEYKNFLLVVEAIGESFLISVGDTSEGSSMRDIAAQHDKTFYGTCSDKSGWHQLKVCNSITDAVWTLQS